jgi:tetratricopeptide (TPR) repeat protein
MLGIAIGASAQQNSDFEAVVQSAAAAQKANDIPRAIELYTQAEQLRPDWATGWWNIALLQYSVRSWPEARDAFTHYLSLSPAGGATVAQATSLRGLCEFATGDFTHSLTDIEQGLTLGIAADPENALLLRLREGELLTRLGRFEQALGVYSSMAMSEPSPELTVAVGMAGLRTAQLPADAAPGDKDLFAAAGDAALLYMRGDEARAQQAFSALFQRYPSTASAHYFYGYLMLQNDPEATIAEYKRELGVAPENVTAAAMLAWVLLSQQRAAEALPYAQKAVSEEPELPVAQLVLGRSLAEIGNLTAGIAHLERAEQLQPGYLETHIALAGAYASAGRVDDARRERLQSLRMAEAHVGK